MQRRRRAGFSLLEVAITLAVLTVVSLSSLLAIVPVARQSRLNREVETANAEARTVLEKIQSAPFHNIPALYPDAVNIPIPTLLSGSVTVDYADPNADPLFVQVTVAWTSRDGGAYSRTFITVRTE